MKASKRDKELETILVLVLALGVFYWIYRHNYFFITAFVIGIAGLLVPVFAKYIHWVWIKISEAIGFVMSTVMLTLVFFIFVVPLGWLSVKIGKSTIRLKPGGSSYLNERNHTYTREDLENIW